MYVVRNIKVYTQELLTYYYQVWEIIIAKLKSCLLS